MPRTATKTVENPLPTIDYDIVPESLLDPAQWTSRRTQWSHVDEQEGAEIFRNMVAIYQLEPFFFILKTLKKRTGWLSDTLEISYLQAIDALAPRLRDALNAFNIASSTWLQVHEEGAVERAYDYFGMGEDVDPENIQSVVAERIRTSEMPDSVIEKYGELDDDEIITLNMVYDNEDDFLYLWRMIENMTGVSPATSRWDRLIAWMLILLKNEFPVGWGDEETMDDILDFTARNLTRDLGSYITVQQSNFSVDLDNYITDYYAQHEGDIIADAFDETKFREAYYDGKLYDEFPDLAEFVDPEDENGRCVIEDNGRLVRETGETNDDYSPDAPWIDRALITFHFAKTVSHHNGSIFEYMGMTERHFDFLSDLGFTALKPANAMARRLGVPASALFDLKRMKE